MDSKDISIITQVAVKVAGPIYAAQSNGAGWDSKVFEEIVNDVVAQILETSKTFIESEGIATVQAAFPGAEPVDYVPTTPQLPQAPVAAAPPATAPAYPAAPPAPPAAPPAAAGGCAKCGGAQWDNRNDNARRRAGGFRLGPDFKCRDQACGKPVWPADYEAFKSRPQEPRS